MSKYIKEASITPTEVLAGDTYEFRLNIVLSGEVKSGSRIVLDMPAYMGCDRPSRFDQEDGGYLEVRMSNPDVPVKTRTWDMEISDFPTKTKRSFKGMAQRLAVLDIGGDVCEGDHIEAIWGFVRQGMGVGTKAPVLVLQKEFYNNIHIRYFENGERAIPDYGRSFEDYERPVPDEEVPLRFRVYPREAETLRFVKQKHVSSLLVYDRFENIVPLASSQEVVESSETPKENSHGVWEYSSEAKIPTPKKMPMKVSPCMSDVYDGKNIYFGDLHNHSAFSSDCIEREKMEMAPKDTFKFAKEVSRLDFMAVTDHHQPWDAKRNRLPKWYWDEIVRAANEANCDTFTAFAGFEFRCIRGDVAVVMNDDVSYDAIEGEDIKDIRVLWERLKEKNYITIPHFHYGGGLEKGEWFDCPYEGVEPYLEIYSCHGSYERKDAEERGISEIKSFREDRTGEYFIKNGYRYGLGANSDGHKGNPGTNGLTAVYAKSLSRDDIFEAIRKRNVYGTTNARIRLLFTVDDVLMGGVVKKSGKNKVHISVYGEEKIKSVDLFKNGDLYKRFKPNEISFDTDLTIEENDIDSLYVRIIQVDNHLAYASPVWFE